MKERSFYGWRLLVCFWIVLFVNLALPLYGAGVINAQMARAFGLDHKTVGIAFMLFSLFSGLPGPLVAIVCNRFGVRASIVLGGGMLTLSSLVLGLLVTSPWQAILMFGVVSGTAVAFGGLIPVQTGAVQWFNRNRARAVSIVLTGVGAGGFASPILMQQVIRLSGDNWRAAWIVIAVLSGITTLGAGIFVRNQPSDIGQLPDGGPAPAAARGDAASAAVRSTVYVSSVDWTVREVLRSGLFWRIMVASVCFMCGVVTMLAHGVLHFESLNYSAAQSASALGVLMLCSLLAKGATGIIGDRVEPRTMWCAAMLVFAAGFVLTAKAQGNYGPYIATGAIGLAYGFSYVSLMVLVGNYFGKKPYASLVGIIWSIITISTALAPVLAGIAFDRLRSYALPFYVAAGLCMAGCGLVFFATPPRRGVRATDQTDRSMAGRDTAAVSEPDLR
ncbi:MFS transporter [Paraburkholderia sediminicola]|uniref:MFS transporter n=1 Tax=Paraburkholderia sediminicola TaxID=458836 RepID=UPI0038BD044C